MTKEDIIAKVKTLNFPKGSYVVFGSCPLAVFGIREANDIDLVVSAEVYKSLENKGWQKIYKGLDDTPVAHDVFEAKDTWSFGTYKPTLKDLLATAVEVDDIPFASLDEVLKWKTTSLRPKDIDDIKLIENYLKK